MNFSFKHFFFVGIVFHELSHYLACILTGVRVKEVRLFDSEEAFIRHAVPRAWQSVLIAAAPFVVGTILGLELLVFALELFAKMNPLAFVFYWLGFSIVLFSFPSQVDAMNAFNSVSGSLKRRISVGNIANRVVWILLSPIIFLPLLLLTGFFLLFDKSSLLRLAWTALLFILSINSALVVSALEFVDSMLRAFFEWLFEDLL